MASSSLACSDVALLSLLNALLVGGREGFFVDDKSVPLMIMCYLGDNVKLGRATQHVSTQALADSLAVGGKYLDVHTMSQSCKDFLLEAVQCAHVASIDQLVDFIESLRRLFVNVDNFQPNGVCAPTCVTRDSPLGVYLRTCLARWECMAFDAICALYERLESFKSGGRAGAVESNGAFDLCHAERTAQTLMYDLGTDDDALDVYAAPSIFSGEQLSPGKEPLFYLVNAQKAAMCLDTHAAEDSIHRFYDSGSSGLGGGPQGPATTSSGQLVRGYGAGSSVLGGSARTAPGAAMDALMSSLTEPPFAHGRHQQAMLALASTWAQARHHHLAMSALEEAMKTAHARGDHAAVAKALLLLHVVVADLGADGGALAAAGLDVSAEEVLARCLERCASLKLRSLSAHAALLMVRHRSRQLAQRDGPQSSLQSASFAPSASFDSARRPAQEGPRSQRRAARVHNLWSLWSSALLGDSKFTARLHAERASHAPLAPAVKDASSAFDYPLTTGEAAAFLGSAALAAVDLWSHLGMSDMAELQARRAVRQLGVHATTPELVALCCKVCYLQIDTAAAGDGARLRGACLNSSLVLAELAALFPSSAPVQHDALAAARLYAATFAAVAEGSWDKALRLARRLVDAAGIDLPAVLSARRGDVAPALVGVLSVEQTKAAALLATITGRFDIDEAQFLHSQMTINV